MLAKNFIGKIFVFIIEFYRQFLSLFFGGQCRFEPTCSTYALECIEKLGPFKGGLFALRRLLKCHPLGPFGFDPSPKCEKEISNG